LKTITYPKGRPMKKTVPGKKYTGHAISLLAVTALLCVVFQCTASACPISSPLSRADTILVQKQTISKKYKIKLYPSATHEVLFFSASGSSNDADGKVYQLYIFDMKGNLVKQANIRNKQTTVLNNIEKGSYLFEIFSNDERIENGQLIVR
jgi:hypothetical protein